MTTTQIESKPLIHDDSSGFDFAKEMLAGDPTAAINFDRIQKNSKNQYIIFEYLLCDEKQFSRGITPYTSHPNKYWYKNAQKFIKLWDLTQALDAQLYLINYSKKETKYSNEILVIKVLELDETGITNQKLTQMTRTSFQEAFRKLNSECLTTSL